MTTPQILKSRDEWAQEGRKVKWGQIPLGWCMKPNRRFPVALWSINQTWPPVEKDNAEDDPERID